MTNMRDMTQTEALKATQRYNHVLKSSEGKTFRFLDVALSRNDLEEKMNNETLISVKNFCKTLNVPNYKVESLISKHRIITCIYIKDNEIYIFQEETLKELTFDRKITLFKDRSTSRLKIIIDMILYLGASGIKNDELVMLNNYFRNPDLSFSEEMELVEQVESIIEKFISFFLDVLYRKNNDNIIISKLKGDIFELEQRISGMIAKNIELITNDTTPEQHIEQFLNSKLINSDLVPRLLNILLGNDIQTPKELLILQKDEFFRLKNFGPKSYVELEEYFLKNTGLTMECFKRSLDL